jgi:hypothetical protein
MKTSLLSVALLAPVSLLFGLAAPVAFGATAILGLSAIALADYGKNPVTYSTARVTANATERHALAA